MLRSIVLACLIVVPTATAYVGDVSWEAGEVDRLKHEGEGQSNCVTIAAVRGSDGTCFVENTNRPERADGYRILDAHTTYVGVGEPAEPDRVAASRARQSGFSLERDAGVSLLVPGATVLRAWYGFWFDEDGDKVIDFACDVPTATSTTCHAFRPGHEWAPVAGATVIAYVEPGSHPAVTATENPPAGAPDVRLTYRQDTMDYEQAGGMPTLRLDGALLAPVRVIVVSNPLAEASPTATLPFTPRPDSRIDIDLYASPAPGPVQGIYGATLAPTVNALGSPSAGACASRCAVSPAVLADTPIEGEAGLVASAVFASDAREWETDSQSSSAGRHAVHVAGPTPWLDVLLSNGRPGIDPLAKSGPVLAKPDGTPLGGYLAFEMWGGLWWDRDGDGFVGTSSYASGTRPRPDDYAGSRGEWMGVLATRTGGGNVEITLTPRVAWPEGVFLAAPGGGPSVYETYNSPMGCTTLDPPCARVRDPEDWRVTGMESVTMRLSADASLSGRWSGPALLFVPPGSTFAFDLCAENLEIPHAIDGLEERTPVWDCDFYG